MDGGKDSGIIIKLKPTRANLELQLQLKLLIITAFPNSEPGIELW